MIKFEGFELNNIEDNIINKELKTHCHILKGVMKALGAKEGSTSTSQQTLLTGEQKDLLNKTMRDAGKAKSAQTTFTESSKKAEDLEGYKASTTDSLSKLSDENKLSVQGIEALRNQQAQASSQVNPDIAALRKIGSEANISFDERLKETTRVAREKLQDADIASRRGGAQGGTALARMMARGVGDYARTVGGAAARAVEESRMQNMQLGIQARSAAGNLGLGVTSQGLQGEQSAMNAELTARGQDASDLAQRRGIGSREKAEQAGNELRLAQLARQQAQDKNLFAQQSAGRENQFELDRMRQAGNLASIRTFKNVTKVKKGSGGLGGALLGAAGAIGGAAIGGPMGAQIGGQLAGAAMGSMGYDAGTANMGANLAGQFGGGGGMPAGGGGMTAPSGDAGGGGGFWNSMFGGGDDPVAPTGGRGSVLNFGPGASPEMAGAFMTPDRYTASNNPFAGNAAALNQMRGGVGRGPNVGIAPQYDSRYGGNMPSASAVNPAAFNRTISSGFTPQTPSYFVDSRYGTPQFGSNVG